MFKQKWDGLGLAASGSFMDCGLDTDGTSTRALIHGKLGCGLGG